MEMGIPKKFVDLLANITQYNTLLVTKKKWLKYRN